MKKIMFVSILLTLLAAVSGCSNRNSGAETVSGPPETVVVQYYIGVIDENSPSPYTYFVKFNDFPREYPITPDKLFHLKYRYNPENNDKLTVKVIAKKASGSIPIAWYIQTLNYKHRSCNDTLYMSNIVYGPDPDEPIPSSTVPGPATQPVPIGVTSPPSNQDIP